MIRSDSGAGLCALAIPPARAGMALFAGEAKWPAHAQGLPGVLTERLATGGMGSELSPTAMKNIACRVLWGIRRGTCVFTPAVPQHRGSGERRR